MVKQSLFHQPALAWIGYEPVARPCRASLQKIVAVEKRVDPPAAACKNGHLRATIA
jgi:hypothetical protein